MASVLGPKIDREISIVETSGSGGFSYPYLLGASGLVVQPKGPLTKKLWLVTNGDLRFDISSFIDVGASVNSKDPSSYTIVVDTMHMPEKKATVTRFGIKKTEFVPISTEINEAIKEAVRDKQVTVCEGYAGYPADLK